MLISSGMLGNNYVLIVMHIVSAVLFSSMGVAACYIMLLRAILWDPQEEKGNARQGFILLGIGVIFLLFGVYFSALLVAIILIWGAKIAISGKQKTKEG